MITSSCVIVDAKSKNELCALPRAFEGLVTPLLACRNGVGTHEHEHEHEHAPESDPEPEGFTFRVGSAHGTAAVCSCRLSIVGQCFKVMQRIFP